MKLPAEMPKITKCLKCLNLRYLIYFNEPARGLANAMSSLHFDTMERSDTIILGILAHFRHFRQFPFFPGKA